MPPVHDLTAEARRVVEEAALRGITLRVLGGVAVALVCPSTEREPLARSYKDLDLVGRRSERRDVDRILVDLGYRAGNEFNVLHGANRLLYWDDTNARQLDVLLDRFEMCHSLELSARLELDELTLPPADLLLTKLQVRETNERDLKDASALLLDAAIDSARVARVLASDWGWWRTATEVLDRVRAFASRLPEVERSHVHGTIDALRQRIDREPKSIAWRVRAKVGDRVRWYEEPEDDYESAI